ncbi:hypothetical protein D9611_001359 [Ephemerocybe angulata]|uniref:3-oxo-5-alpha-steroid 4-dehydrogenase C-terminal domain-containing protein n=1 Tax=Ephemerocybe angulata TaxID=980116 RepID=A0A8H5CIB5_9AGAR|nr:hypothetical protein D9611_001359 [Tulosesus angulatus]
MVSITVSAAAKAPSFARDLPISVEVEEGSTIGELKQKINRKFPKFSTSRQKITLKGDRKPLDDATKIETVFGGKLEGAELQVKDMGPQISWKTVFLIEYVGPLIVHPIFYYFPKVFYGRDFQHSALQKYVFAFVMLHFLKRELETLFVHRFSHGTMPFLNVFKNSFHYHVLSGLLLAAHVYSPKYAAGAPAIVGTYRDNATFLKVATAVWAFAEVSNFHTHLTLRNLRPAGTKKRAIPAGYGFNLVSFPNYFFEILGWVVISVMTNSIASHFFVVVATVTMAAWALKKHKNYKKEFGKEYPRSRKAIFPFIL